MGAIVANHVPIEVGVAFCSGGKCARPKLTPLHQSDMSSQEAYS